MLLPLLRATMLRARASFDARAAARLDVARFVMVTDSLADPVALTVSVVLAGHFAVLLRQSVSSPSVALTIRGFGLAFGSVTTGGSGSTTGGSGSMTIGGSTTGGSMTGGSTTGGLMTGGSTTGGSMTGGSMTGGSTTGAVVVHARVAGVGRCCRPRRWRARERARRERGR